MKFIDRVLRDWRIRVGSQFIRPNDKILDIGCFDGHLFKTLKNKPIKPSVGLDPLLEEEKTEQDHRFIPGKFPDAVPEHTTFDAIVMLAVLEHIPKPEQQQLNQEFYKLLHTAGRIIITVPSPLVDYILVVLTKLRLIDGMSLEEHYGFKVNDVYTLFDDTKFKLVTHNKFQLGLNNLFVFEKLS